MILKMDRWITAIKADDRDIPQIEKVVQNKPADLQEGCYTRDAIAGVHRADRRCASRTRRHCEQLYPTNSFPREVAGASIAADIIKCQLKPLAAADYAVSFTRGAVGAAAGDLPARRVRLVAARRRAAGSARHLGVLRLEEHPAVIPTIRRVSPTTTDPAAT